MLGNESSVIAVGGPLRTNVVRPLSIISDPNLYIKLLLRFHQILTHWRLSSAPRSLNIILFFQKRLFQIVRHGIVII